MRTPLRQLERARHRRSSGPAQPPAAHSLEVTTLRRRLRVVEDVDHDDEYRLLPIAVTGAQLTLLCVAADTEASAFRSFLNAHRALIERVHRGIVRIAVPRSDTAAPRTHTATAGAFFRPPLRPSVLEEFRWYCHTRLRSQRASESVTLSDRARFLMAKRAFGAARFFERYRDWLKRGDAAFSALLSPRLHDLWRRGEW